MGADAGHLSNSSLSVKHLLEHKLLDQVLLAYTAFRTDLSKAGLESRAHRGDTLVQPLLHRCLLETAFRGPYRDPSAPDYNPPYWLWLAVQTITICMGEPLLDLMLELLLHAATPHLRVPDCANTEGVSMSCPCSMLHQVLGK